MTGCVIRRCAHIRFQSSSPTSKRNCVWGSHFICFSIIKTPFYRSELSQVMIAGAITMSQSGTACSGRICCHLPLKSSKPWHQQTRSCSPSFSTSKVHYSLSTEEPLTPVCTVQHSKAYAGPSRTKGQGCSWRVWFCSMIMCIHMFPGSHLQNWPSSSKSSLTIHPTARHVALRFLCVWSPEKPLKGLCFNSDNELQKAVKDWVLPQPQEFWKHGILQLVNQWDCCTQAYGVYFE